MALTPIDAIDLAIKSMEVARHARQDGEVFWPPEVDKVLDAARTLLTSPTSQPHIPKRMSELVGKWRDGSEFDPVINAAIALFNAMRYVPLCQSINSRTLADLVRISAEEAVRQSVAAVAECGRLSAKKRSEHCDEIDQHAAMFR